MEYLSDPHAWLFALMIFALRVVDMSLDTIRVLFVVRGKKLVVLVGTRRALAMAVNNNRTQQRFTGLKARLQGRLTAFEEAE